MRISDWSSDVCSSDLLSGSSGRSRLVAGGAGERLARLGAGVFRERAGDGGFATIEATFQHSEEDTSHLSPLSQANINAMYDSRTTHPAERDHHLVMTNHPPISAKPYICHIRAHPPRHEIPDPLNP